MIEKRHFLLLTLLIIVGNLLAQTDSKTEVVVEAEPEAEKEYTSINAFVMEPRLPVPGYEGILADSTGVRPSYYSSADQKLLLLKGPVVKGVIKTARNHTESFLLDDNGWIIRNSEFNGTRISRNPQKGNRIESITNIEEDYDGGHTSRSFRYDESGWLLEITVDTPEGAASEYIHHNTYHDPLSTRMTGFLGDNVNWSTVYTVTKTDCFHNWLERDVKSYDNGKLIDKWHESRTLYYLSVIDKQRGTIVTRPFTHTQNLPIISSETGGRIFFYYGTKWKYYRVWGKNEKHTHPELTRVIKSVLTKPTFPGGTEKLTEYLSENLQYPAIAKATKTQGTVKVKFKVSKTGEISDISVVQSVSEDLDSEAKRLVMGMPKWKPADRDGKAVDIWYTLPLSFSLK